MSLMGTNFPQFLLEANRVLKQGGLLFVAEVISRFTGEVTNFCQIVREEAGFKAVSVKKLKDFFYLMIFEKVATIKTGSGYSQSFAKQLKPCIYKRR